MAILKEYRCLAHGPFESPTPSCPHGCSERFVTREIRTAPGLHSERTKRSDWAINALAEDFGYSDMNNSPSRAGSVGEWVSKNRRVAKKPEWVDVPHAEPGFSRNAKAEIPRVGPEQFGSFEASGTRAVVEGRRGRGIPTKEVLKPKDV